MSGSAVQPGETNRAQVMRTAPLLANVPEDDVRALAELSDAREHRAGQPIFREGDPGDAFHTIVTGAVRIVVVSSSGSEATLATLGRGDSIGELALLDGRPRSATALVTEPTTTLRVARDDFRAWIEQRPNVALAALETLGLRLRRTNDAIADLSFLELSQRIAKRVLQLALEQPTHAREESGDRLIRITQSELASMVGSSREAVNKHLKQFEQSGFVALRRGVIVVLDDGALEQQIQA
ncbi:MAG TPA: Crp/Fnr family transcriptional regulator [Dehalococcoidia bacterium]|nr:Crp/Fnr family transcriptional regulator [Dehalococcoidia bacterium]